LTATNAFSAILNIAATICILFAVPIVMPVAGLLGTLLLIFGVLFGLGTLAQIYTAYKN
jgi:hypothetical protein